MKLGLTAPAQPSPACLLSLPDITHNFLYFHFLYFFLHVFPPPLPSQHSPTAPSQLSSRAERPTHELDLAEHGLNLHFCAGARVYRTHKISKVPPRRSSDSQEGYEGELVLYECIFISCQHAKMGFSSCYEC